MGVRGTTVVLVVILLASGGVWFSFHASAAPPKVVLAPAVRGDIVQSVNCTATVSAPTTVDVGSQVSGTVVFLGADFNALVRKGQVLARLDPRSFEAELAASRAGLQQATAGVAIAQAAVEGARENDVRLRALASRDLETQSDADEADVELKVAEADLHGAEAAVAAARAEVEQRQVDLNRTVIVSPVDGIVVDRRVDVGQTVAANFQAPSLFKVAAALTRVQLLATVDESDVGHVRAGQVARFRVDAYPDQEFEGRVSQVRLQPTTEQLMVTYSTVIDVDNRDLRLRPGLTATVTIETARRDGVMRVPTQALRFRPTTEVLDALGERAEASLRAKVPAIIAPGQDAQVWVGGPGHLSPHKVRVGLSDGPMTEVVDGLAEGATVAVAASVDTGARRGRPVR